MKVACKWIRHRTARAKSDTNTLIESEREKISRKIGNRGDREIRGVERSTRVRKMSGDDYNMNGDQSSTVQIG